MKSFREQIKQIEQMQESKKSDELAKSIDKAILKIDDTMSYKDLALAVAKILKDDYGSHNFEPFIKELKDNLKD